MLAYFVEKLRGPKDGDGTLLDHSLVLYGSNMGNSNQHLHYDVPHVLVGGASGELKGDRHLAFRADGADRQPAAEHSGYVRRGCAERRRQHRPSRGDLIAAVPRDRSFMSRR